MQTQVTKTVKQMTHDTRIPWFSVSLASELYFGRRAASRLNHNGDQGNTPRPSNDKPVPPGVGGAVGVGGL